MLRVSSGSRLANAAPGMTGLCSPASATSAPRLKGTAHFVAIGGARKSHGHGASWYLHTERHLVSSNASSQLRGATLVLKRAAQFRAILLDLHRRLRSSARSVEPAR
jgi:hypothetical protein